MPGCPDKAFSFLATRAFSDQSGKRSNLFFGEQLYPIRLNLRVNLIGYSSAPLNNYRVTLMILG